MFIDENIFEGYENTNLVKYDELEKKGVRTVKYSELGSFDGPGVLKSCQYVDGELVQTYSERGNHVGVIAATRLGKTTSYVIPTVLSFAAQKVKKSFIVSDPKGEIYRYTAETLKKQGYKVKLLNFRNYKHSECWNPLTPIYRKYHSVNAVYDEVQLVTGEDGKPRNCFQGKIYEDETELRENIDNLIAMRYEEVGNEIDNLAGMFMVTSKASDPYWEDSARDLLKAFLWAMLEDSDGGGKNAVTEDTYSFNTILRVVATFNDGDGAIYNDNGYFTDRKEDSRAYILAKNTILENGRPTRKCIMGVFMTELSIFAESAMRLITSCNSFEMSELGEGPIAIFIDYRDELKAHFRVIGLFIQDAYRYLIERANDNPTGQLEVPFYFILDEFGNFPAIKDFETTISACAGRNVFFILIIQSYAQLNCVYGDAVAEIIRDNLNVHVFFGSNNPSTLEEFSRECGQQTRISPLSALNGTGAEIEHYVLETIPLVTKSRLSHFEPGECIITEANCGYVMLSMLERFYACKEFENLPLSSEKEYVCPVNAFDGRFNYSYKPKRRRHSSFD